MNVPNLKQNFDITYEINEHAVICYIFPQRAESFLYKQIPDLQYRYRTYKGVAVKKSGDMNDIQLAKQIAKNKAIRSYYKAIKNFAKPSLIKELNDCIERFEYLKKIENKINRLTDNIVKLAHDKED